MLVECSISLSSSNEITQCKLLRFVGGVVFVIKTCYKINCVQGNSNSRKKISSCAYLYTYQYSTVKWRRSIFPWPLPFADVKIFIQHLTL